MPKMETSVLVRVTQYGSFKHKPIIFLFTKTNKWFEWTPDKMFFMISFGLGLATAHLYNSASDHPSPLTSFPSPSMSFA